MKKLIVALNVSKLSVPEKINRARHFVESVASHPNIFTQPSPSLATMVSAIDDLELAWNDAADGGKSLTAIMHDKEDDLDALLTDFGHYVQSVANGDPEVVHKAGMDIKVKTNPFIPEFSVENQDHKGAVKLRVKPKAKTIYRWEYCMHPLDKNQWTGAHYTDVSTANISDLESEVKYWFRVVFISRDGENIPYEPLSIVTF